MRIVKEINGYELKGELWSGAINTLETIVDDGKLSDLMDLLEEIYPEPVDITMVNDLLWFEDDFLFEHLNIKEPFQKRL